MIRAPSYNKDVVDGINACNKRCLIGQCVKSRINTNSMLSFTSYNLVKEYTRLCEDEIRINVVKKH